MQIKAVITEKPSLVNILVTTHDIKRYQNYFRVYPHVLMGEK